MQSNIQTENAAAILEVVEANGHTFQYTLREEASVFVGSSSTCGLRLDGKGVEDIHCMLLSSGGQLRVHGWHTGSTTLNGEVISEESEVRPGDRLEIGEHQIVFGVAAPMPSTEPHAEPIPIDTPASIQPATVSDESSKETSIPSRPLGRSEVETVAMHDFDFNPVEDLQAFEQSVANSETSDLHEILQIEVEQLRMELAHRDAQLAELQNQETDGFEIGPDDESTVRLVNRLEDLLEELEDSDRRSLELEQLLRLSDEATRAEREEREHLESWMQEIENRVSQRESESEAQLERLQCKLDETRTQLEQSEDQVRRVLHTEPGDNGTCDDSRVVELQKQNADLESRWRNLSEESESLRDQLENSDALENALAETTRLEQQMLQMEVDTSRERAELTREKSGTASNSRRVGKTDARAIGDV